MSNLLFYKEIEYNQSDLTEKVESLYYFISDLHLSANQPELFEKFVSFVENELLVQQSAIINLYILGDLFDYWVGDRAYKKLGYKNIVKYLKTLSKKGIRIYIMHGNRDFLLGKMFTMQTRAKLICEPTLLEINHKKILLMHGDSLCSDDIQHQKFRHFSRKYFPFIIPFIPIFIRLKLAKKLRNESIKNTSRKSKESMDVTSSCLKEVLDKYCPDIFIHGHTHNPAIHIENVKDKEIKRIVLSNW